MSYKVKQEVEKKKNGSVVNYWVVVNEAGRIANECRHSTEKAAGIHCRNLNAFFR